MELVILTDEIIENLPRGRAYLADQFQRASTSIILNIAEGAGEFSANEKVRFYRMARRSATECAGILARISHTFSDSSHTLHAYLASQTGEAVLLEHCPRPFKRQSRSAERRSVQRKCEKSGLVKVEDGAIRVLCARL
jgi:four helix bundle protein